MANILVADIGGTSSRFAHFVADGPGNLLKQLGSVWLRSQEVKSFAELLGQLSEKGFSLQPRAADICVFAVAGPVEDRTRSNLTNLSWSIDLADSAMEIGGVKGGLKNGLVINDFLAQAFSAISQVGDSAKPILGGEKDRSGAIAVIGAGTGLGKAIIAPTADGKYFGLASEGGHATLGVNCSSEIEVKVACELTKRESAPYATWEHVLSGKGLSAIHRILTGEMLEPKDVAAKFATAPETLALFARFYGRACRDFALEVLAKGGVYIAGGVAAKNPEILMHPNFAEEFHLSKVHHRVLAKIPVSLIENEESGLWGAAAYGQQELVA